MKLMKIRNLGKGVHLMFVILTLPSVFSTVTESTTKLHRPIDRVEFKAALAPSSADDLHQNNVDLSLEFYDDHETEADGDIVYEALERVPQNISVSKQDGGDVRTTLFPEILDNAQEKKSSKQDNGNNSIALDNVGNVNGNVINEGDGSARASELNNNDVFTDVETDYRCSLYDEDRAGCLEQARKKRVRRSGANGVGHRKSGRSSSELTRKNFPPKSSSLPKKSASEASPTRIEKGNKIPQGSGEVEFRDDYLFIELPDDLATDTTPSSETVGFRQSIAEISQLEAPTRYTDAAQDATRFEEKRVEQSKVSSRGIPLGIPSGYTERNISVVIHRNNSSQNSTNVDEIVILRRKINGMGLDEVDSSANSTSSLNEMNTTFKTLVKDHLEDADNTISTTSKLENKLTSISKSQNSYLNRNLNRKINPRCFMNNKSDIYAKVNKTLPLQIKVNGESVYKLNCAKKSQASKDFFLPIKVLDDFTVEVEITEAVATSFYLECRADGRLLCSRTVDVGYVPLDVEGFDCISYSWTNLACWYSVPNNPVQLPSQNYQICIQQEEDCDPFTPEKQTPTEAASLCSGPPASECWLWDGYPFARPYLNLTLKATNGLGSSIFHHTINNYAKVLPSRPTNLSANSTAPTNITLFWRTPETLVDFPPGLQYRVNITSPYWNETVSGLYSGWNLTTTLAVPHSFVDYRISVALRSGEPGATRWSGAGTIAVQTAAAAPVVAPLALPGMFQVGPSGSLRLYWHSVPRALHGGPHFSYAVERELEDDWDSLNIVNRTVSNRTYMDLTVQRNSSYRFLILSTNSEGESPQPSLVLVAPAPPAPAFPAAVGDRTGHHFLLRWYNTSDAPANYTLYYCSEWASPDIPCKTDLRYLMVGNSTSVNISLGELQPPVDTPLDGSTGAFAISAQTEKEGKVVSSGLSWSPCTVPYSADPPPHPELTVANISDGAAMLQWELPCPLQPGVIVGVQLRVCDVTDVKCDAWLEQPVWTTSHQLTPLLSSHTYQAFMRVTYLNGLVNESQKSVRFTTAAKSLEGWQVAVIASAAIFGTLVVVLMLLYSRRRFHEKYKEATLAIKTPNLNANNFISGGYQNSQEKRAPPSHWPTSIFNKAASLSSPTYVTVQTDDRILNENDPVDEEASLMSRDSSSGQSSFGSSDKELIATSSDAHQRDGLPTGTSPPDTPATVDRNSSETVSTSPLAGLHYSTIGNDDEEDFYEDDRSDGAIPTIVERMPAKDGYSSLAIISETGTRGSDFSSASTGVNLGISSIVFDSVSQFSGVNESQDLMTLLAQKTGLGNLSVEDAVPDNHTLNPSKMDNPLENSAYVMAGVPRPEVLTHSSFGNCDDQTTKIRLNDGCSSSAHQTQCKGWGDGSSSSHILESSNEQSKNKMVLHEDTNTTCLVTPDLMTFLAQQAGLRDLSLEDVYTKINALKPSGVVHRPSFSPYVSARVSLPELNLDKGGAPYSVSGHGEAYNQCNQLYPDKTAKVVVKPLAASALIGNYLEYQAGSCPDLTINQGEIYSGEETQKFMFQLAKHTGLGKLSIEDVFPKGLDNTSAEPHAKVQNSPYVMTGISQRAVSGRTGGHYINHGVGGKGDPTTGGNLLPIKWPPGRNETQPPYVTTGVKRGTFEEISATKCFSQIQPPYVTTGAKKETFEMNRVNHSLTQIQPYVTTDFKNRTFEEICGNQSGTQIQSPYVTAGVNNGTFEKKREKEASCLVAPSHALDVPSDRNEKKCTHNQFSSSSFFSTNIGVPFMPNNQASYNIEGYAHSNNQNQDTQESQKAAGSMTALQLQDNTPQFVWLDKDQAVLANDDTVVNIPGLGLLTLGSSFSSHIVDDRPTNVEIQKMANPQQYQGECFPELPAEYVTSGTKEALESTVNNLFSLRSRHLLRRHHSSVDSGYVPSESESSRNCGDRWSVESNQIYEEDEKAIDPFGSEQKIERAESVSIDFDECGEISTDYLNYILTKYQNAENIQEPSLLPNTYPGSSCEVDN